MKRYLLNLGLVPVIPTTGAADCRWSNSTGQGIASRCTALPHRGNTESPTAGQPSFHHSEAWCTDVSIWPQCVGIMRIVINMVQDVGMPYDFWVNDVYPSGPIVWHKRPRCGPLFDCILRRPGWCPAQQACAAPNALFGQ